MKKKIHNSGKKRDVLNQKPWLRKYFFFDAVSSGISDQMSQSWTYLSFLPDLQRSQWGFLEFSERKVQAAHQGVVAQVVFEVLCCASSKILPNHTKPTRHESTLNMRVIQGTLWDQVLHAITSLTAASIIIHNKLLAACTTKYQHLLEGPNLGQTPAGSNYTLEWSNGQLFKMQRGIHERTLFSRHHLHGSVRSPQKVSQWSAAVATEAWVPSNHLKLESAWLPHPPSQGCWKWSKWVSKKGMLIFCYS